MTLLLLLLLLSRHVASAGGSRIGYRIFYSIAHFSPSKTDVKALVAGCNPSPKGIRIPNYAEDVAGHVAYTLQTALELCEKGFHVTVQLDCGYKCSTLPAFNPPLLPRCTRAQPAGFVIDFREHSPEESADHKLVRLHRDSFFKEMDNHDLFIYLEDDIFIASHQIQSWVRHSLLLSRARLGSKYEIGWFRQELNISDPNLGWVAWEETNTASGLDVVDLGHGLGWHVLVTGQTYQATWMATREKMWAIHHADPNFFNTTYHNSRQASRESMANSFFWERHFKKVIPLADYERFGIHHMANFKTFEPRGHPRPVRIIYAELLRAKTAKETAAAASLGTTGS